MLIKIKELQLPGKQKLSGSRQEGERSCHRCHGNAGGTPQKKQQQYYSGKKKRHTLKVQLVVAKKTKRIICTAHDKGKTHDFKVFKKSKLPLNEKAKVKTG